LLVLQARVDGDGMDLFQPMLDTARRKAAVLGLAPALHRGATNFRMPRRYALVMITLLKQDYADRLCPWPVHFH
jgi:hypothetical protein